MRVIEVLFSFPPEVFMTRHIIAMREKEIDLVLVALGERSGSSKYPASIPEGNLDVGKVNIPFPANKRLLKYFGLRYLLKPHTHIKGKVRDKVLSAFIESLDPDIIHFQMGTLAGYLYKIPQSINIPYTISLRGSDIQVLPFESQEKFTSLKTAIEGAAGVHTVCDALWKSAVDTFSSSSDKIFHKTIYTTVPLESYRQTSKDNKRKIFVAVGRLHWTKSLSLLLIAFYKFHQINPDSVLYIIGDGEVKEEISYWIRYLHLERNVILKGKMSYSELAEIILNADAFIQSSIAEGFSNATAEAMALGCPVFATDVGGTNEIIEDGVNGFLLDPILPESWAHKFQMVYDKLLMQSIGENARKTAEQKFSKYNHADEFVSFYQHALNMSK